jgi:hypothetical protein
MKYITIALAKGRLALNTLEMLASKREARPAKKHGNIPL